MAILITVINGVGVSDSSCRQLVGFYGVYGYMSLWDFVGYDYIIYDGQLTTSSPIAILITVIKGVGVSDSSSRQLVCRPTNATTLKTLLTHYCFTIQACGTLFLHFTPNPTTHPLLLYYTSKRDPLLLYHTPTQLLAHYSFTPEGNPSIWSPPCFTMYKQADLTTVHPQYPTTHTLPQYKQNEPTTTLQYQQYLPILHFSIHTLLHYLLHTVTNFELLKARGPFLDGWCFVISSCQ